MIVPIIFQEINIEITDNNRSMFSWATIFKIGSRYSVVN